MIITPPWSFDDYDSLCYPVWSNWILLLFLLFLILLIPLAYLVVFLKTESAAVVVIENFEK